MSYQVVDARGHVLTLDDDEIVPDGCRLWVPTRFMDRDPTRDRDDEDDNEDADEEQRLADAEAAEERRADAWAAFRDRLQYRRPVADDGDDDEDDDDGEDEDADDLS